MVLNPARPGANLVRDQPAAVLVVEIERALVVLVHEVAPIGAVEEVGAEALLLVPE